jgi:hypothetical protein
MTQEEIDELQQPIKDKYEKKDIFIMQAQDYGMMASFIQ